MAEPTSVLTFEDLILEAASRLGMAYQGSDGSEQEQVPVNAADLTLCKRVVNNAIRMFVQDAPPIYGWRWMKPTSQMVVWGDIAVSATETITAGPYDLNSNTTTLTLTGSNSFYETMEEKTITLTGVDDFVIKEYVSATQVKVTGDASAASAVTWSMTADGHYTLPRNFSGQYDGVITYSSNTNQGISLEWTSDGVIRQWRENITDETGDPFWACVRVMSSGTPRRRWELMLYPTPDEVMTVEFPYYVHFDKLVDLTEVSPAPFSHDETVRAAVRAVAEKDYEDERGVDWDYYKSVCLPNSHRMDSSSVPRNLGYFGNPSGRGGKGAIQFFRDYMYQRPSVNYNE